MTLVLLPSLRHRVAALATVLAALAAVLVLRASPVLLVHDASGRMYHPGDGFDIAAGRQLVEGLEVAAAALGLVGRLRMATITLGLAGLVLFALHS